MRHIPNTSNRRSILVITGLVIVIILAIATLLFFMPHKGVNQQAERTTTNLTPAQAAQSDTQKNKNIKDAQTSSTTNQSSATFVLAKAEIDSTGKLFQVRAYSSSVIEDGGTCTATFSKTGYSDVSVTSSAFGDATTTQCGVLDTSVSNFPAMGVWHLAVSYASSTTSAKVEQDVTL